VIDESFKWIILSCAVAGLGLAALIVAVARKLECHHSPFDAKQLPNGDPYCSRCGKNLA